MSVLLNKYGSLYIKPFCQSQGRGILNVIKTNTGIHVIDEKKHRYRLIDDISANKFLKDKIGKSIIQQAVQFKIGNQQLDFRVFLKKTATKNGYLANIFGEFLRKGASLPMSGEEKRYH